MSCPNFVMDDMSIAAIFFVWRNETNPNAPISEYGA